MSNSNETSSVDLRWVLVILIGIGLVIVGFYFFNFNSLILKNEGWWKIFQNLSADTGNWGTFGDYVGGILNPVIAGFAFYLIAKTYELQKRELKLSTDALNDQVKLAALTALLNSNLTRISLLESEKVPWLELHERGLSQDFSPELDAQIDRTINRIEVEIEALKNKSTTFEEQIKVFLKEETE